MKIGSFRNVNFTIEKTSMYGHYKIKATYKGKYIDTITTDSEAYDWIDDYSDKYMYQYARRHCYNKIVSKYNATYV